MTGRALGRCCAPGSLGRHVYGAPDWAGRRVCDCGRCRRFPPGTSRLPVADPLAGFLARLYAPAVTSLADLADVLGLPLPSGATGQAA